MTYGDFKDLSRKTTFDKVLHDKAFNIAKNPKYDGYQRGPVSMVYKVFDKKACGSGIKNESMLSDCNGTRTHNHLVRKRTLNHLAKLAK